MSTLADYLEAVQQVTHATSQRIGVDHNKNLINRVIRRILKKRAFSFMDATFAFRTWPRLAATVTLTQGKRIVTLTAGQLTLAYQGGFIVAAPTAGTTPRIRLRKVLTTTTFEMEAPWGGDTQTGVTADIWQDKYPLPFDCESIHEGTLWYESSPFILSPLPRRDIEIFQLDNVASEGDPWSYVDKVPNQQQIWSTGTVVTVDNTDTINGVTAPDWDDPILKEYVTGDVLVGWSIKFKHALIGDRVRLNGIKTVNDLNTLELEEEYHGKADTISYEAGPKGHPMMQLWPAPDVSRMVGGLYRRRHLGLYDEDDVSPIPDEHEDVVSDYACARAIRRMDEEQGNLMLAREFHADYMDGLKEMMADDHPNRDTVVYPVRHEAWLGDSRPSALRNYAWFDAS